MKREKKEEDIRFVLTVGGLSTWPKIVEVEKLGKKEESIKEENCQKRIENSKLPAILL